MLDADVSSELRLERADLGAVNVGAALDDPFDRFFQPIAQPPALRTEIDELHPAPEVKT
jgi:hypothetical protein